MDACRRDHLLPEARRTDDWTAYHSDSVNDLPCYDVVKVLNCFRHCGHPVVGITARPKRWRAISLQTLCKFRIQLDELLMHQRDNWEPSADLKLALAHERFGAKLSEKVLCIIDDHPEVVKAFQSEGVTALQVHGRKYELV
jgi:hypothetical protein